MAMLGGTLSELRSHGGMAVKVSLAAAVIGLIYGYDTGNIAGVLLFVPDYFHLGTSETSSLTTVVVAGMIVGAAAASRLADRFGRKPTMLTVAICYAVFAVLSGVAMTYWWLMIARVLLGITIGVSLVTAPIFVAESAPAAIRGALVVGYQVATVAGITVAYFVDFGLAGLSAWRWMLALGAVPAVLVALLLVRLPDTARWYVAQGKRERAREVLQMTDPSADADAEIREIEAALRQERGGSIREMLRPPFLRATIFVLVLGFLVQITGVNAITYYSPLIFKDMGFTGNFAVLALPGFIQIASLIGTIVALAIVDRVGRRIVLLSGIVAMLVGNALLIVLYASGASGAMSYLGFVGILVFDTGFNFGFGALVWVYASESFPARLRTIGASVMLTADLVANLLIAQLFLGILGDIGGAGTFGMFFGLAAIALWFVHRFAPETKGRRLEDIQLYWENGGSWPSEPTSSPSPTDHTSRHAA